MHFKTHLGPWQDAIPQGAHAIVYDFKGPNLRRDAEDEVFEFDEVAFETLAEAASSGADYAVFVHGTPEHRKGEFTTRALVRDLMCVPWTTEDLDRSRCRQHADAFVAALRADYDPGHDYQIDDVEEDVLRAQKCGEDVDPAQMWAAEEAEDDAEFVRLWGYDFCDDDDEDLVRMIGRAEEKIRGYELEKVARRERAPGKHEFSHHSESALLEFTRTLGRWIAAIQSAQRRRRYRALVAVQRE